VNEASQPVFLSEEMFSDIKSMETPYENSQTAKERAGLTRHSCEIAHIRQTFRQNDGRNATSNHERTV
jgi:hypothetical protein